MKAGREVSRVGDEEPVMATRGSRIAAPATLPGACRCCQVKVYQERRGREDEAMGMGSGGSGVRGQARAGPAKGGALPPQATQASFGIRFKTTQTGPISNNKMVAPKRGTFQPSGSADRPGGISGTTGPYHSPQRTVQVVRSCGPATPERTWKYWQYSEYYFFFGNYLRIKWRGLTVAISIPS